MSGQEQERQEERWTLPICTGCGGILGWRLDGGCTCDPSHAKTGRSIVVVPLEQGGGSGLGDRLPALSEAELHKLTEIGVGIQMSVERGHPFPGDVEDAKLLYKLSVRLKDAQPNQGGSEGLREAVAAKVDERISDVRFNHPSGMSATRGITVALALKMVAEHGGSVDVYLADHKSWFLLVEGPRWRIDTLRAALSSTQPDPSGPEERE